MTGEETSPETEPGSAGQRIADELADECGYDPQAFEGRGDALTDYKDSCEGRMIDAIDEAEKFRSALETLARGVPTDDAWDRPVEFQADAAVTIGRAGVERPAHYPEEWS